MTTKKVFTLVFPKKDNLILMGYKTRGLGKSLWNGFGGKVENNESIVECAHRELKEESNLVVNDLNHLGVVKYEEVDKNSISIVHVFTCNQLTNKEHSSEEMNPIKWYETGGIPFDKMWPDAPEWFSFMLNDQFFSAHIIYQNNNIIESNVLAHQDKYSALKLAA